jgi:hypothetical protein
MNGVRAPSQRNIRPASSGECRADTSPVSCHPRSDKSRGHGHDVSIQRPLSPGFAQRLRRTSRVCCHHRLPGRASPHARTPPPRGSSWSRSPATSLGRHRRRMGHERGRRSRKGEWQARYRSDGERLGGGHFGSRSGWGLQCDATFKPAVALTWADTRATADTERTSQRSVTLPIRSVDGAALTRLHNATNTGSSTSSCDHLGTPLPRQRATTGANRSTAGYRRRRRRLPQLSLSAAVSIRLRATEIDVRLRGGDHRNRPY